MTSHSHQVSVGLPVAILTSIGGLAIPVHIYWHQPVWLVFLSVGGPSLACFVVAWNAASPEIRGDLATRSRTGLLAGAAGLISYDVVRWTIVLVAGLSVNPFEAFPLFGQLLIGASSELAMWVAGILYHILNGLGFAVFFTVLIRRPGPKAGVLWALILEVSMLAIYPGWLDIQARSEFTIVSLSGHIA